MDENIQKITLKQILYYIGSAMLLITKGLGLDEGDPLFRLLLIIGSVFIICKMLMDQYDIKEVIWIGALGLWGVFTFYHVGTLGLIIYIILIAGMKDIPLDSLFKIMGAIYCSCVFITITMAVFGSRVGVILIHEKFGLGPLLRESLGYTHPNVLHVTYVVLMMFVLYNCGKCWRKVRNTIILLLIGNLFVFMYSISTTGILMSIFYLLIHMYLLYRRRLCKLEKVMLTAFIPASAIFPILFSFLNENSTVFKLVNKMLNNRVLAIKVYFKDQGISLFGEMSKVPNFSLDNSFASALFGYGIIFFIIIVTVYGFLMRYLIQKDMRREIAILCALFWGGMSEPFLFNASVKNITVFLLGYYIYDQHIAHGFVLHLFSQYDRNMLPDITEKIKVINVWNIVNRSLQVIGIIAGIFLLAVLVYPSKDIKNVYADQGLCDCNGELISVSYIDRNENNLYIGEMREGEEVYHFSENNSHLIKYMIIRHKISIFLYLIADVFIVGYNFQKGRKRARKLFST